MKYPVYCPEITEKEKEYVLECLNSTWISSKGEFIRMFEQKVEEYTGSRFAITVSNGTAALHLALLAAGIKTGDEIIIPDFTYIATANAVLYAGAVPVLVDADPESWNINPGLIEKAVNRRTKAIIVTDIYGTPPEMDIINGIALKHNLLVIEDAAEALGASYKGIMAGNLADIGTFSFFGNKTITTGEGGMLLTNNPNFAERVKIIKNQGNSESKKYYHEILGYNYRMTNIQAAIGLAQIERIESIMDRKRQLCNWYLKYLKDADLQFQIFPSYIQSSFWMVSFMLKNKEKRDELMEFLGKHDIETRPFFFPVHQIPYYRKVKNPVSVTLSERGINVPSYPMLTETDIQYISRIICDFLAK